MYLFRIFLIFLLCFVNPFFANGRTVYVSTSEGDSYNNGYSINHPTNDIIIAISSADTILLKAGDYFYVGNLKVYGKTLSRYGEGGNPTICGYKRLEKPKWNQVEENIWCLNLLDDLFSGIITKEPTLSNNICAFHDFKNDLIHGYKVQLKKEMQKDWDFWQTETIHKGKPEEYNNIYLFLTTDPNRLQLELSIYDIALRTAYSTIEGINFQGFGFGISAGTKTIIRNCRIDAIGGRITPDGDGYTCYGNGIEFYVGGTNDIENCLVEGCYVTRCYDCGITIQGSRGTTATPKNIIIQNNLITNCCQGWEDFLRNNPEVKFENCIFRNNIVLRSGNTTGWRYHPSRFKFCHILGNNFAGDKGMIIEGNTFADGNFYCSGHYNKKYKSNIWKGNICYISSGEFLLGEYNGTRDVLRVNRNNRGSYSALEQYRELTGDCNTVFHVVTRKKELKIANKFSRKFLKKHSY